MAAALLQRRCGCAGGRAAAPRPAPRAAAHCAPALPQLPPPPPAASRARWPRRRGCPSRRRPPPPRRPPRAAAPAARRPDACRRPAPAGPRRGHLGFTPKKRCRRGRGRIKAFPRDDASKPVHLTGFMGYKAGMTHIIREVEKPGSKLHKKETCEPVTIIETPPMIVVGVVGYAMTARGLRGLNTVWAEHLSEEVKRRFYKNWYKAKRKAFTKYAKKYSDGKKEIESELEALKKHATVIRVLAHTQVRKVNLGIKKAQLMEIQVSCCAALQPGGRRRLASRSALPRPRGSACPQRGASRAPRPAAGRRRASYPAAAPARPPAPRRSTAATWLPRWTLPAACLRSPSPWTLSSRPTR